MPISVLRTVPYTFTVDVGATPVELSVANVPNAPAGAFVSSWDVQNTSSTSTDAVWVRLGPTGTAITAPSGATPGNAIKLFAGRSYSFIPEEPTVVLTDTAIWGVLILQSVSGTITMTGVANLYVPEGTTA